MSDDRDDLAERVAALEDSVRELRADDRSDEEPSDGEESPTPRDARRFADEYAIPAAIAALEANVRALELLQSAIGDSPPDDRERDRSASQSTLERVDRALDRLLDEMAEGSLPRDADARNILKEARSLRDEIDEHRADPAQDDSTDDGKAADDTDDGDTGTDDGGDDTDAGGVVIDVEDELASIQDELDRDASGGGDAAGDGDDAGGSDADDAADPESGDGDPNG